jgi:Tol biopolymer transport system component
MPTTTIDQPALFAPGIVSTNDVFSSTFTADGRTVVFTRFAPPRMTLMQSRLQHGKWTPPVPLPFSGTWRDNDPSFSPDDRRLYFASYRPSGPGSDTTEADLWYVERLPQGWSAPVHLGAPFSSGAEDFYPSQARAGALYFDSRRDASGRRQVYRATAEARTAQPLSAEINADSGASNFFIDPAERYAVFAANRPDGRGSADLYISFRRSGSWTLPQNLGSAINTPAAEFCPFISRDGAWLYFTRATTTNGNTVRNIYVVRFDRAMQALSRTAAH